MEHELGRERRQQDVGEIVGVRQAEL